MCWFYVGFFLGEEAAENAAEGRPVDQTHAGLL